MSVNPPLCCRLNSYPERVQILVAAITLLLAVWSLAQTPAPSDAPYKIVNTTAFIVPGRIDYIYADSQSRRLYVPRGDQIMTFDLDTLQQGPPILGAKRANGLAIDPMSHHGFASGKPLLMWDTTTSQPIKTIDVPGDPSHSILFDPLTERVFAFALPPVPPKPSPAGAGAASPGPSAAATPDVPPPVVTVLDGKDGSVVGTVNLGGIPEQAASDGQGHLYVNLKDKDSVAVVDVKTLKVIKTYPLDGKSHQPGGLALDVKNHRLFVFCLLSNNVVILDAADGKILQSLPIGRVVEAGVFNPQTMEAFSSQGDGTLTVIKENSPTSFAVEQTVITYPHSRTCTLDLKTNHVIVIFPEHLDQPPLPTWPAIVTITAPSPSELASPRSQAGPAAAGTPFQTPPGAHQGSVRFHIYVVGR